MFSARYVDTDLDRPRWRFTTMYRVTPRLQAGFEYNPAVGELGFIGNYIIATETEDRPMISFGTSSDRIGTPEGPKAYYVTFAKSFPEHKVSPYVGISYSEYEDTFIFPAGATVHFDPKWDFLTMYDGRNTHVMLTRKEEGYSVSLMYIWLKRAGISVNWGF